MYYKDIIYFILQYKNRSIQSLKLYNVIVFCLLNTCIVSSGSNIKTYKNIEMFSVKLELAICFNANHLDNCFRRVRIYFYIWLPNDGTQTHLPHNFRTFSWLYYLV